ncbi:uncharacterized protein IL334_006926 [Kwoniella shivajii]|uniref:ENTH domain-containing protein n=1 Tax=Kwoniella shivajii TaxID=564305 RepID=A0ABZ1D9C9_9TREE|nr:hypothetical protein IL334_006926 [Kwoniella shivajii]
MDYLESITKQAQQLTMYDVKSYYNQAKNMVLNVSEMEAKVREATNDDPWGASSTLMQQIADGAQFNEIMPTIYARFMEKEAREWRQIYKALTLLEFLVKNGSERVVDDARAHISTIKMLRSFHYIDEKGKDQGINVRNRSSEIASLLGDVEKIRVERRKAKQNKNKYQGGGNDNGMSFVTTSGSRYGGFGSDSVSGGGGGGGGSASGSRYGRGDYDNGDEYRSSSRGFRDTTAKQDFDEYEGADDFDDQPPRRTTTASTSRAGASANTRAPPKPVAKEEKHVEKPKEVNLFDFDDEPAPVASASAPAAAPNLGGDDDFDDFQQAPSAPAAAAPPQQSNANANLFNLLNANQSSVPAPQASRAQPTSTPQYNFSSPPIAQPQQQAPSMTSRPSYSSSSIASPPVISPRPAGGASTFDDLFASSLTSMGGQSANKQAGGSKTIKDLEKEKTMSSLWGPTPTQKSQVHGQQKPPAQNPGSDFDDLLL